MSTIGRLRIPLALPRDEVSRLGRMLTNDDLRAFPEQPSLTDAEAVEFLSALRAFIVRKEAKEHGTGRQIEGNLAKSSRVIIVDDVVTTAGSTLKAIEAAEAAGHTVVAVICLVDREEGGAAKLAAYPFYSLFKRSEIFG